MRLFTYNLTAGNSLTIASSMGVVLLSVQMSGGTTDSGTMLGNWTLNLSTEADLASQAIDFGPNGGHTVAAPSNSPLDGIVLACITGTMKITMGF